MSVRIGVLCEYTRMIIVETDERNNASESPGTKKVVILPLLDFLNNIFDKNIRDIGFSSY